MLNFVLLCLLFISYIFIVKIFKRRKFQRGVKKISNKFSKKLIHKLQYLL